MPYRSASRSGRIRIRIHIVICSAGIAALALAACIFSLLARAAQTSGSLRLHPAR